MTGARQSASRRGRKSVRLLVVDDDPSMAGMLNHALQEWGYDVLLARNGGEGLDVVGRRSVDGILPDIHMPMMNGRTMLDEWRWPGHQMPVLMMPGRGLDLKEPSTRVPYFEEHMNPNEAGRVDEILKSGTKTALINAW